MIPKDTFSCIPFDLPHFIFKVKLALFPLKGFYLSLKKSTLPATFSFKGFTTSYTTNALNTRDFYPVLGEITWVR